MQPIEYRNLLLHMEWADSVIWGAVIGVPSLAQDQELRARMHHFHSTQWAYLQTLRGAPLEIPALTDFADLAAVGRWARRFYHDLPVYRDALDEEQVAQTVVFPWAALLEERLGNVGPATVGECILQLALHTAHHRGQVAMQLRAAGTEPPMTDFIAWVWMRRPAPKWDRLDAL